MTKQHYEHLADQLRVFLWHGNLPKLRQFERRNWVKGFGGAVHACMATLKYDNHKFSRERFVDALLEGFENVEDLRDEIL